MLDFIEKILNLWNDFGIMVADNTTKALSVINNKLLIALLILIPYIAFAIIWISVLSCLVFIDMVLCCIKYHMTPKEYIHYIIEGAKEELNKTKK